MTMRHGTSNGWLHAAHRIWSADSGNWYSKSTNSTMPVGFKGTIPHVGEMDTNVPPDRHALCGCAGE